MCGMESVCPEGVNLEMAVRQYHGTKSRFPGRARGTAKMEEEGPRGFLGKDNEFNWLRVRQAKRVRGP